MATPEPDRLRKKDVTGQLVSQVICRSELQVKLGIRSEDGGLWLELVKRKGVDEEGNQIDAKTPQEQRHGGDQTDFIRQRPPSSLARSGLIFVSRLISLIPPASSNSFYSPTAPSPSLRLKDSLSLHGFLYQDTPSGTLELPGSSGLGVLSALGGVEQKKIRVVWIKGKRLNLQQQLETGVGSPVGKRVRKQARRNRKQTRLCRCLGAMITGTSRYSALLFRTPTPDQTPQLSPAPSDSDSDDDNAMEGWHSNTRPLSLAIPSTGTRPTLDDVLSGVSPPPYTLSAFMAFLSQNHCLETLEFTMEAKRYQDNYYADPSRTQHLCKLFQRILTAYIFPASPREINVSSEVRDDLLSHSNSPTPPRPETLDSAVRRMRDLMEESIFLPFLHSQSPPAITPHSPFDETKAEDDSQMPRHSSIRRQLSPQSSFASPRSPIAGYSLPSNTDVGLHAGAQGQGHSPKARPENSWKKMGLKLGWKKRPGGGGSAGSRDGRSPPTEED
ncbi:predicted protein [Histoplasma mississippiense (nom. inval.)]|uniref:predicted protein n=1 Tax=Ajellomyces capsulatus (strain NAm1 / WU24) TaxID=2059318 RepID=UPI000157C9F2|nr:predicted protein [Histoplasma mississippiense (nom. inval.)]EDN09055.1 predicted protein [Histoplasma mississippiense (nom. inval.)]